MTVTDGRPAPLTDCTCDVCVWTRQRILAEERLDADLEHNYKRYLAGKLVSDRQRE